MKTEPRIYLSEMPDGRLRVSCSGGLFGTENPASHKISVELSARRKRVDTHLDVIQGKKLSASLFSRLSRVTAELERRGYRPANAFPSQTKN